MRNAIEMRTRSMINHNNNVTKKLEVIDLLMEMSSKEGIFYTHVPEEGVCSSVRSILKDFGYTVSDILINDKVYCRIDW